MNIGDKAPEILGKDEQGREVDVRQKDHGHHSHHLCHQRGGHHRTDICRKTGEDQGACRTDTDAIEKMLEKERKEWVSR